MQPVQIMQLMQLIQLMQIMHLSLAIPLQLFQHQTMFYLVIAHLISIKLMSVALMLLTILDVTHLIQSTNISNLKLNCVKIQKHNLALQTVLMSLNVDKHSSILYRVKAMLKYITGSILILLKQIWLKQLVKH